VGPSPGEAGSNLLKSDRRRRLTKRSSLHKKRSSLRGRTKVAKVGPLRARVKSAKVRPTPYVYYPPVRLSRLPPGCTRASTRRRAGRGGCALSSGAFGAVKARLLSRTLPSEAQTPSRRSCGCTSTWRPGHVSQRRRCYTRGSGSRSPARGQRPRPRTKCRTCACTCHVLSVNSPPVPVLRRSRRCKARSGRLASAHARTPEKRRAHSMLDLWDLHNPLVGLRLCLDATGAAKRHGRMGGP
jgi:hypothetical protein